MSIIVELEKNIIDKLQVSDDQRFLIINNIINELMNIGLIPKEIRELIMSLQSIKLSDTIDLLQSLP
jgi:hypothetical protein